MKKLRVAIELRPSTRATNHHKGYRGGVRIKIYPDSGPDLTATDSNQSEEPFLIAGNGSCCIIAVSALFWRRGLHGLGAVRAVNEGFKRRGIVCMLATTPVTRNQGKNRNAQCVTPGFGIRRFTVPTSTERSE